MIADDFQACFRQCDVIAGPVAPTVAWKLGEQGDDPVKAYLADIFTLPGSLAGLPGMSVPAGAGRRRHARGPAAARQLFRRRHAAARGARVAAGDRLPQATSAGLNAPMNDRVAPLAPAADARRPASARPLRSEPARAPRGRRAERAGSSCWRRGRRRLSRRAAVATVRACRSHRHLAALCRPAASVHVRGRPCADRIRRVVSADWLRAMLTRIQAHRLARSSSTSRRRSSDGERHTYVIELILALRKQGWLLDGGIHLAQEATAFPANGPTASATRGSAACTSRANAASR